MTGSASPIRFGVVCPPLKGHLDPMAALARALAARGHRATVFIEREALGLVPPGLEAAPLDLRGPTGLAEAMTRADRPLGLMATIRAMARRADALCEALPDALARAGINHVLADQAEPAGALAARALALPYASIANGLPLNREDGLPPPFVGWPQENSPRGVWLNRGGYRVGDWLMRPVSEVISRRARQWGLTGLERLEDCFSPSLQLFQLPRGLDFPRKELERSCLHVGPFRQPDGERFDPPPDPLAVLAPRPLAFCSLGTLQGGRAELFHAFAAALAELGLRAVIVHGGRLSSRAAAALPGHPVVADFLPQRAVLARSRLAILHGGLNSVLDALSTGVPMIVTPIAFEQGAIAARVAASGAGLAVKPRQLRRGLRPALGRLLREPAFVRKAQALQVEIAMGGGADRAAALIEAAHHRARAAPPGDAPHPARGPFSARLGG